MEDTAHELFLHNRGKICDMLTQSPLDNFENITTIFKNLEWKYGVGYTTKLIIGSLGYESNKQMALYTIPTTEFCHIIGALQIITGKKYVHEFFAGLGLFSGVYEKYCRKFCENFGDTAMLACDGERCMETISTVKYFDVTKKSIERYIIDKTQFDNAICVALIPTLIKGVLGMFVDICNPECMVIVVPEDEKMSIIDEITSKPERNNKYHTLVLKTKIISRYDNYSFPNRRPKIDTIIISKRDITRDEIVQVLKDKLKVNEQIIMSCEPDNENDVERIIEECIENHILPKWTHNLVKEEKEEILKTCCKLLFDFPGNIENVFYAFLTTTIKDMVEFREYVNMKPRPPLHCSTEKFIEYKQIYTQLSNNYSQVINEFKERGILPSWIDDKKHAILYIYFDYESSSKKWKVSKETFENYIRSYIPLEN